MALSLAEAAKLSTTDLQRGVIETFVQESPILDRLPLMTIEGNAYAYNSEATLPGVEFRAVNAAYSESTGTVNTKTESLVILGGDADVDTFIAKTRGNLNDQRAIQEQLKVKASAYKFQDAFFNGDTATDPQGFDGLRKRLVGNQVLSAGTNGLGPIAGGHDFFDALDALIAQVPGLSSGNGALYANRKIIAKIASSARRLGGYEMVQEALTGKRVATYQGIPLLDPGQTAAGVDILPTTETQGTATDASSIYAVKFGRSEGDKAVTGLTNGGVTVRDLGELDSKPAFRTRIEFFCGVALFGGQAAARLNGVLAK
ncbi:phage major capsid protein [Kitasatospora purpeofusca]|uniref:major capsid protein n=1 Tax=Kitasatospora purpeofusca TaxID=67352 RepID=UPI0022514450|nr:phage major capsid protein [Kitasatospora purpeofusca]MCX4687232.1 phage major capsid protein [Kitasatospora purpeofusca]